MNRNRPPILLVALAAIISFGSNSHAWAIPGVDSIRDSLSQIARSTGKLLKDGGIDSIGIGQFTGPPSFGSSSGPGIRQILKEEFAKIGIKEKKLNARVGIQGKYLIKDSVDFQGVPIPNSKNLTFQVELVDQNGSVLTNVSTKIDYFPTDKQDFTNQLEIKQGVIALESGAQPEETGRIIGATADLMRGKTPSGVQISPSTQDVLDTFSRPTVRIEDNTLIAASRQSPYWVQILVNGKPAPILLEEGQPFVDLKKEDVFSIKYYNETTHQTSVKIHLDGVSLFAFSQARIKQGPQRGEPAVGPYLIEPKSTETFKGWYISGENVDTFKVTDFANSAAAKFGSTNNLGMITISTQAAWPKGQKPPADEPVIYAARNPDIGIGRGERIVQRSKIVTTPMEFGSVRSLITIRYVRPN